MNTNDYDFLAEFLQKASGLSLGQGKAYLLESRLMPIANSLGLNAISELVQELKRPLSQNLKTAVIEAMTTNETLFFRDKKPFEDLVERMLPTILEARQLQKKLRIWCAACSSGQEPYSIVMSLREYFPQLLHEWNVEIIATDLNDQIIAKAKTGVYSQFEVQRGLSIQMLMKYFHKMESDWQINPEVQNWIQ